jgi:hypothetical protein
MIERTAWELRQDDACAILTAIREPTPALLDDMMAAVSATRDHVAIWNAAIDAALGKTLG